MMKPQPLVSWHVRTPALTPAACGCAPNVRTPTAATAATIANRVILAIKLSLRLLWMRSVWRNQGAEPPPPAIHPRRRVVQTAGREKRPRRRTRESRSPCGGSAPPAAPVGDHVPGEPDGDYHEQNQYRCCKFHAAHPP